MSAYNQAINLPPFPPDYRASGVLLHVTSLPSPYGIGDLGPAAFAWIDRLCKARQTWWQALPGGPTGYANSPYQSLSSFAGNGLLISPARLIEDGLLRKSDCEGQSFPASAVDYDAVIRFKHRLLDIAWFSFISGERRDLGTAYETFCHDHARWLSDYALFRALKAKYNGTYYLDWPIELVQRRPSALAQARRELAREIDKACFAQFLLFRQADQLKHYAHAKGVWLIGDLPFFVSPDSSDVWTDPELFILDERRRPSFVAGVPPDYFSANGQRWGNPVYDWEALHRTGYGWCVDRLRALLAHVDVDPPGPLPRLCGGLAYSGLRIDSSSRALGAGPKGRVLSTPQRELGGLPFIAEDLGLITPDVRVLRDQFHLPGTKVLQFAFDGHSDNPYLPENYGANTVVYTGTHDNDTTRGWFEALPQNQREKVWNYLKRRPGESSEIAWELIRLAWPAVAALAIAPLQDVLNLGTEARMNLPGRVEGNWRWRCTEDMLSDPALDRLRELTTTSNRLR
jgi:4-alpha-glucanotransferase